MSIDLYLHILQTCCKIEKKKYKNHDFTKFYDIEPTKHTLEQNSIHFLTSSLIKIYQEAMKNNHINPFQEFVKAKHQKYMELEKSIFIETYKNHKNTLIKVQRTYLAISRFAQICKQKSRPYNDTDLTLTPITSQKHIKIYQNKKLYVFTLFDIMNIVEKPLCNCDNFFIESLPIKNPYNNLEFNDAQLYNIYFKIKESLYAMPELFNGYFKSNFDMKVFKIDYESQIRNSYIQNKIYKTNDKVLFEEIRTMIFYCTHGKYKIQRKLCETSQLPEFIKIMRPYYYLYLYGYKYVHGLEKTNICHNMLKNKIYDLYYYNPQFGRVKFKREPITNKFKGVVDLEHPGLKINDIKKYTISTEYRRQHIVFDYYDEDTDSQDDNDDEYDEEMQL